MINSENKELAIAHDNEVAYVLSKFNADFIYNTVNEALNMKLRHYEFVMPNIVSGYEVMFKQIISDYPTHRPEILETRQEVYTNILRILCDYYCIQYEDYDSYDLYTSLAGMYNLLVSGFQQCVCNFFFNFIIKEKDGLYASLNLAEKKKNKDIGTAYIKKVFTDTKIGIICANLDFVVASICCMDISFDTYLDIALDSVELTIPGITDQLKSVLSPQVDFVKTYIAPIFNTDYSIAILTTIKLKLQEYCRNDGASIYGLNNEEDNNE